MQQDVGVCGAGAADWAMKMLQIEEVHQRKSVNAIEQMEETVGFARSDQKGKP
jgi:hypothetical protein